MSKEVIKKRVLDTNNIHILNSGKIMVDYDFSNLGDEEYEEVEKDMAYIYYDIYDFDNDDIVKEWLSEYVFRVTNVGGDTRDTFEITDDGIKNIKTELKQDDVWF